MLISCQACPVAGERCGDCMVTAMHRIPLPTPTVQTDGVPAPSSAHVRVEWSTEDLRVLDVLCDTGLVSACDAAGAKLEATVWGGHERGALGA